MHRLFVVLLLVAASTLLGCASTPQPPTRVAAHTFDFRLEGQLGSISVADLDAIVRVVHLSKIGVLRVVSRDEVHIDTSPRWLVVGGWRHGHHYLERIHPQEFSAYIVVRRTKGVWQDDGHVFTIN